jgi:hypothetical protein
VGSRRRAIAVICRSFLVVGWLVLGCSHTYRAAISVERPESAQVFTHDEQERAKRIAIGAGRAAGFLDVRDAPEKWQPGPSDPYDYLVTLSGEDFEQATVHVSAFVRRDRREIVVSIVDLHRREPLPATQRLIEDVRAALEREFPDARVDVEARTKLRTFAP